MYHATFRSHSFNTSGGYMYMYITEEVVSLWEQHKKNNRSKQRCKEMFYPNCNPVSSVFQELH